MSYYRTCPYCGANLDPGESCDCKVRQSTKTKLLQYITESGTRFSPVSRAQMARQFEISDREIRSLIEELRNDGNRICSSSARGGYWFAESEEDYKRFRAEYLSRAAKQYNTVLRMDGAAGGQMEMMFL